MWVLRATNRSNPGQSLQGTTDSINNVQHLSFCTFKIFFA